MNHSLPQTFLALVVITALVAAQQLFSLPGDSSLWRAFQDSLHAPWFFVVVCVLYWWLRREPLALRVMFVCAGAVVLSFGTEFIQGFVDERTASGADLVKNAVGGMLGLVFALALHASRAETKGLLLTPPRIGIALISLLLLVAFTLWQPLQEFKLYQYRSTLVPKVVDFEDERTEQFIGVNEGGFLGFGTARDRCPELAGARVLRLTFGDSEYPTLYINEVMQVWAPYRDVVFDLFVPGKKPLPLTLGVQYEGSEGTSAFSEGLLSPGPHRWVIPRSVFVPDGATGLRVRNVLVYTTADQAGRSVLLGRLFLQ